jgi:hypothetical protein
MPKNKRSYEEGSIIDLAVKALQPLKELFESREPSHRLLGLNMVFFFVIMGLSISFFMGITDFNLASIVVVLVSFLFSAILMGVYSYFMGLLKNVYKIKPLKWSISILLITLPLSVFGLLFNIKLLILASFGLILFQAILILFCSVIISDNPATQENSAWGFFGKVNTILGLISSVITIAGFILKFI